MMENQHSIVYNNNIMSVYPFEQDRQRIFNLVKTSPVVKLKESFMRKWMNPKLSLGHRIVAYMGAEGIGFSASFAFIDWGKIMGYKLEGMFHANDYISADESQHTIGGAAMEHYIANKISDITELWYCGVKNRINAMNNGVLNWKDKNCTVENLGIVGERAKILKNIIKINQQDDVKILPKRIFEIP